MENRTEPPGVNPHTTPAAVTTAMVPSLSSVGGASAAALPSLPRQSSRASGPSLMISGMVSATTMLSEASTSGGRSMLPLT